MVNTHSTTAYPATNNSYPSNKQQLVPPPTPPPQGGAWLVRLPLQDSLPA